MASNKSISGVYDVVIVGAGIMGSSTAYNLAKLGKSVLLLEQFDFLHRRGSSHGESRTLRLTYPEDYYTLMASQSLKLWQEAQNEAGYEVYTRTGQLDFGHFQHPGLLAVIKACERYGVAFKVLRNADLAAAYPMLNLPDDYIGVHTEEAGILRATKAVAMMLSLAAKHGAVLRDQIKVNKIERGWKTEDSSENAVLVGTNLGSVLARKCIVTAGAWTAKLVKQISGVELPIQPLNTFVAYWETIAKESFHGNRFPSFACYDSRYMYGTPTLEYPGLIKIAIHGGLPCDPDNRDHAPDVSSLKKILSPWVASTFKNTVNSEGPVMAEACMYSMTPDQDFIIDYLPGSKDVIVASGFSGHGFKMGPVVGKIMGQLAFDGGCGDFPMEMFSFGRFMHSPLGNKKNFDPVQELHALGIK